MTQPFPGPLSPADLEAAQAYYGGAGISSSAAAPPLPPGDPAAYYGPPPPPSVAAPAAPAPPSWWDKTKADIREAGNSPEARNILTPWATSATQSLDQIRAASTAPPAAPASPAAPAAKNAAPQGGGGTTPAEDRAFRDLVAGMPDPNKPKAAPGAGPSGPSGPSAIDKATKALRGTFDEDKAAIQRGANAETDRAALMAQGSGELARQKMDDEAGRQVEASTAAQHFADYQAETQRQIDAVRQKTIQPNRAYADTGSAVTAVIGGVLGGIYQGLNKLQSNPFLDQMNKTMDRDIAAQEADLATAKGAIAERKGMLADMRTTYKDEALAKLQARNLYYEGAKEQLAAEAATYDSPAIQARADQAISAISREQAKLDIDAAMKKASAAAGAAAAAEHRRQTDFNNRIALQKVQNETLTAGASAAKDLRDAGGGTAPGDTIGAVPKAQVPAAIAELAVKEKKDRTNTMLDTLQSDATNRSRVNPLNAIPGTDAGDRDNRIDVLNSQIVSLIRGQGDSDAKSEERLKKLQINYTDNDAQIQFKIDQLREKVAGNNPTPILDRYSPKAPPKAAEFNLDGSPKK